MRKAVAALTVLGLTLLARPAAAQTGSEIVKEAMRRAEDRTRDVENYTIVQEMGVGGEASVYFERDTIDGRPVFVIVPPHVVMQRAAEKQGHKTPTLDDPGIQQSLMQMGMKSALDQIQKNDSSELTVIDPLAAGELADRVRLIGREQIDRHETYVLVADDLSDLEFARQSIDDGDFEIRMITVYVDAEDFVTRKAIIEGVMHQDGQTIPVEMESRFEDYREVDGMLHPFRTVFSSSGMAAALSEDDLKKMEEAKKQMAEMQEELAKMPEAQRSMVESMMKKQMAKVDDMFANFEAGAIEMVIEVIELRVNAGPPPEWLPLEEIANESGNDRG